MMARAVIYCRCSTEEETQKNALLQQVGEARESILQKGWLLIDEYVESKSGTTTGKRAEYGRLYEDMMTDKFDIIVIKSQDRLMRNTKDWYLFLDRLVTEHKQLYMYLEHKFYSPDEALITGIKAILAEEYSRELSKKINNAHLHRQKNNGAAILTNRTYGLKKLPDKSIELIDDEVRIKKRMYELCAEGYGCRRIADILKNEGITNREGRYFNAANIGRMIRNPLNKGTVVMNRKHFDFDTKRILNIPEDQQYIYKNKVPAIVSEELWTLANAQMDKRRKSGKSSARGYYTGKSMLSGKLRCGICGESYYRRTRHSHNNGVLIHGWSCRSDVESGRKGGCDNIHLDEKLLYNVLEETAKENVQIDWEKIIRDMCCLLKQVFEEWDIEKDIQTEENKKKKLRKQMDVLIEKLLDGVLSDEIYKKKQEELQKTLDESDIKLQLLEKKRGERETAQERISEIEKKMKEEGVLKKVFAEELLDEIQEIIVFPTCFEIRYKNQSVAPIEFGNLFDYHKKKKEKRECVVDMMREHPKITAKEIARELGISLSGANYQLRMLKREGRIRFNGRGGHGTWVVEDVKNL